MNYYKGVVSTSCIHMITHTRFDINSTPLTTRRLPWPHAGGPREALPLRCGLRC